MTYLDSLPEHVAQHIRTRFVCEFATVSKAGVPIDSPLVPFTSADLETIDAGTGLAYPAKAERARRNPKVGLLFEGTESEPVVSISGMAAVRDTDFQSNLDRYLSEEILTAYLDPNTIDYGNVTRKAIWYFTRMLICVKPAHVRWWDNPAAMDNPPQEWRSPAGTEFPLSDPAAPGTTSLAPWAESPAWQPLRDSAISREAPGHLTLIDPDGFPLPIRARQVEASDGGFRLALPKWQPWPAGKATLSFEGIETFVGEADIADAQAHFRVERALPILPLMADPSRILDPDTEIREALMERLEYELGRRRQPFPVMPAEPPEPTPGARLRAEAAFAYPGVSAGAD